MTEPLLKPAHDGPSGYAGQFDLGVLQVRSDGSRMRQAPLAERAGRFSILACIDAGQVPVHGLFFFFKRCGNWQSPD